MARKFLDYAGLDHLIQKLDQRYGGGGGPNNNIPEKAFYCDNDYFYEVSPTTPTWQASSQYIRRVNDYSGSVNVGSIEQYFKITLLGMAQGYPGFEGLQFCNASIISCGYRQFPSNFEESLKRLLSIPSSYEIDSIRLQAIGSKWSAAECSLKIELYLWSYKDSEPHMAEAVIVSTDDGVGITPTRII